MILFIPGSWLLVTCAPLPCPHLLDACCPTWRALRMRGPVTAVVRLRRGGGGGRAGTAVTRQSHRDRRPAWSWHTVTVYETLWDFWVQWEPATVRLQQPGYEWRRGGAGVDPRNGDGPGADAGARPQLPHRGGARGRGHWGGRPQHRGGVARLPPARPLQQGLPW